MKKLPINNNDKLSDVKLKIEKSMTVYRIYKLDDYFILDAKPAGNGGTYKPFAKRETFDLAKAALSLVVGEVVE